MWFKKIRESIFKWTKAQKTLALGVVLLVTMALAAAFSDKGFMNVYDFAVELDYLKQNNANLMKENERIQREIDALKSDPYAVEMVARDKLNMVKPGEQVYQIVREGHPPEKIR
jgi:cell division protein FtsB